MSTRVGYSHFKTVEDLEIALAYFTWEPAKISLSFPCQNYIKKNKIKYLYIDVYTVDTFLFAFKSSFCCMWRKSIPCYSLRQHPTSSKRCFWQIYCGWSFPRNECGASKLIILPYCYRLLFLWWKLVTWMLHAFCPSEMCPIAFPGDSNSSEEKSRTTNMRTLHKNTPNFHNSRSLGGWQARHQLWEIILFHLWFKKKNPNITEWNYLLEVLFILFFTEWC